MTAIATETLRVSTAPVIALKGRGSQARTNAYMLIAPLSFIENASRVDTIDNLRKALGLVPTPDQVKAAQTEWMIGRVASRLPAGEMPKGADDSDKLDFARKLVMHYAAPAVEGKKARALRAGQLGRRSVIQHKVVRAAEEAWSQVNAELGHGTAKPQAVKNAAKRAPKTAPRGEGKGTTPSHAELIVPSKAVTADEAHAYIMQQATTLQQFASKNARIVDVAFGQAVVAFKAAINKAANERAVRKAAADAIK